MLLNIVIIAALALLISWLIKTYLPQNIKTIFSKELRSYFNSPIAYIVIIAFLIVVGYFFTTSLFQDNLSTLRSMFNIIPFLYILFIPVITMRLFSEEKKQGTIELLLTKPITDYQLVIGKFLAAFVLTLVMLLPTLLYFIVVALLGKIDMGSVFGGYLGLIFTAGVYIGIGLFASSLTENQIVAAIISIIAIFALFMMGKILMQFSPALVSAIEYLSTDYHFTNISRGVIDSRNLIYYFSMIFFTLFLTKVSLESRKW